jgi:hypothetical protein
VRYVTILMLLAGLATAHASSGQSTPASTTQDGSEPPSAVISAVTHHWKGATLAEVPHAAPACAERGAQGSRFITGDFNGDGSQDVALAIQTADGIRIVAAMYQTHDYVLKDVAAKVDLTNAVLSVRRHGEAYRVPNITVDNYFSLDTIVVTPCGQASTAYLWTGSAFTPQELARR